MNIPAALPWTVFMYSIHYAKIQMDVAGRGIFTRAVFSNLIFWQAVYHSVVLNGSGAVVGPEDGTQHHLRRKT